MNYSDVIRVFGPTQTEVADALKVSQGTVCKWQRTGIPILRQMQIEKASGGRLKADPLPPLRQRRKANTAP